LGTAFPRRTAGTQTYLPRMIRLRTGW
jgi:hypothetical protein